MLRIDPDSPCPPPLRGQPLAVLKCSRHFGRTEGFEPGPPVTGSNKKAPANCAGAFLFDMAEREGFEPSIRCRIHTFQACSFSHSDTSPKSYCLPYFTEFTLFSVFRSTTACSLLRASCPAPFGPSCGCPNLFLTNLSATRTPLLNLIVCRILLKSHLFSVFRSTAACSLLRCVSNGAV